jgi:hypothetical protein
MRTISVSLSVLQLVLTLFSLSYYMSIAYSKTISPDRAK